ncbi:MAG: hypothetical protein ACQCN6_03595 [Candidatus Bathyarchaeia archaeon]|jgi:uncharacterized membrane protein YeaQ/YmgE (transglycosylase-associated protein family)
MASTKIGKEEIELKIQRLKKEEEFNSSILDRIEMLETEGVKKIEVSRGLILGLAIGIVGNIFAQFLYAFFDSLSALNYVLLYISTTVLVASACILGFILRHYLRQIRSKSNYIDDSLAKRKNGLKVRQIDIEIELEDLKKELADINGV